MFIARKTHAKIIPQTAKMEMTTKSVRLILEGRILRNVRSTGGLFPPETEMLNMNTQLKPGVGEEE